MVSGGVVRVHAQLDAMAEAGRPGAEGRVSMLPTKRLTPYFPPQVETAHGVSLSPLYWLELIDCSINTAINISIVQPVEAK